MELINNSPRLVIDEEHLSDFMTGDPALDR